MNCRTGDQQRRRAEHGHPPPRPLPERAASAQHESADPGDTQQDRHQQTRQHRLCHRGARQQAGRERQQYAGADSENGADARCAQGSSETDEPHRRCAALAAGYVRGCPFAPRSRYEPRQSRESFGSSRDFCTTATWPSRSVAVRFTVVATSSSGRTVVMSTCPVRGDCCRPGFATRLRASVSASLFGMCAAVGAPRDAVPAGGVVLESRVIRLVESLIGQPLLC